MEHIVRSFVRFQRLQGDPHRKPLRKYGQLRLAEQHDKLRLSGEHFSYEPYGLMMRRGDNAFQAKVNRTLSTLYRSGLVQIYERWFGPFATASPLVKALYLLHSWPD